MKDVIRRGVDRQVAEGMFERAQERMPHQFQQLKVLRKHGPNSSPKEAPGEVEEASTVVVIWAQGEPMPPTECVPPMPTVPGEAGRHRAFTFTATTGWNHMPSWGCDFRNAPPPAPSCIFPL